MSRNFEDIASSIATQVSKELKSRIEFFAFDLQRMKQAIKLKID